MVLNRLNNYSFFGIIRLFNDLLYTKLFFPTSRLIRRPFYIRGKKYINLGSQLTTGVGCRLDAFSKNNKIAIATGFMLDINKKLSFNNIAWKVPKGIDDIFLNISILRHIYIIQLLIRLYNYRSMVFLCRSCLWIIFYYKEKNIRKDRVI